MLESTIMFARQLKHTVRESTSPRRFILDAAGGARSAILLVGSARSGTTWIAETLNYNNTLRHIFEPLHGASMPPWARLGSGPRSYLRPDADVPGFRRYFEMLISGSWREKRSDHLNRCRFPKARLIKEIHANLLISWVHSNFPEAQIVFLVRHPLAMANSYRSLRMSDVHTKLGGYLKQEPLMEDYLDPYRDRILETEDDFDRVVLLWCLENYVALRQCRKAGIPVFFYEPIYRDPREHLPRVFRQAGLPVKESVFRKVREASPTSWGQHSSMKEGRDPLSNWRGRLSPEEVRRGLAILERFGLDAVYGDDHIPRPEGLEAFDRFRPA